MLVKGARTTAPKNHNQLACLMLQDCGQMTRPTRAVFACPWLPSFSIQASFFNNRRHSLQRARTRQWSSLSACSRSAQHATVTQNRCTHSLRQMQTRVQEAGCMYVCWEAPDAVHVRKTKHSAPPGYRYKHCYCWQAEPLTIATHGL